MDIEGRGTCKKQCDHCNEYFAPIEADKKGIGISYSEKEVKALFEKLVNDFPIHRGIHIAKSLPKWFEENKKK